VNVRSNLALAQKRFLYELDGEAAELEDEYLKMSAQVVRTMQVRAVTMVVESLTLILIGHRQDKVTLKLFSAMVDANKIERAADLVDRLHNELSFDLAIQIAGRHDKLADIIEDVKFKKINLAGNAMDESNSTPFHDEGYSHSPETTMLKRLEDPSSHNVSPDAGFGAKSKREAAATFQSTRLKKHRVGGA
jgi:hypothetical protein